MATNSSLTMRPKKGLPPVLDGKNRQKAGRFVVGGLQGQGVGITNPPPCHFPSRRAFSPSQHGR